jgi:large subunit ribosomal protein L2
MALRQFNPVTASLRGTVLIDRSDLWKGKPVKALTEGKIGTGGRNNHGRITSRFIGGGHKQSYRYVDFKRRKFDVPATVERLEYDPNRSAFIALVKYRDGELSYILAPQRLRAGDSVVAGQRVDIKPGNAMPMAVIPVGTIIHNIEMKPGAGGKIARAAGTYAQLVGKDAGWAQIKLMSGELRMVRAECMASIGAVSNPDNMNQKIGKAGRTRWLGKRPHNRGVVMNPVDHPLGGGAQLRRTSSGDAVGQAHQGLQDAQQQADGRSDHPPPQQGQVSDGAFRLEGSVRRWLSAEQGGSHACVGPQ